MTAEDNKKVVRRFCAALETGNLAQIAELTTDDFTFWVAPTTVSSGTYAKEQWLQLMAGVIEDLAGPISLRLGDLTAEEDRVSLTMIGNIPFKSGKVYNSHYHNLFSVRDGKISAVKEYLDTYHAGEVFGFPVDTE